MHIINTQSHYLKFSSKFVSFSMTLKTAALNTKVHECESSCQSLLVSSVAVPAIHQNKRRQSQLLQTVPQKSQTNDSEQISAKLLFVIIILQNCTCFS